MAGSDTRKPAVESPPYPAQRRRTWRYDVDRARNGGPLSQRAASPLGGPDKPTSGPFDDRLGRGREDRLRRTDRRLRAGAGSKDPSPSGRPGLQRPEDPSSAAPGFRRDPGAAGSPEALEGASTARVGPPLPRRERAALLAERDGGAQARRPSEPATGARSGPEPATTAGPRSLGRDRRPRGAASAWANRPDRSPTDRPRSPPPRRFRVANKRRSNS